MTSASAGLRPGLRSLLAQPAYLAAALDRAHDPSGRRRRRAAHTLALLIVMLTGTGTGVSTVGLAEILPVLLLAPLAGSLVDRLPRVR